MDRGTHNAANEITRIDVKGSWRLFGLAIAIVGLTILCPGCAIDRILSEPIPASEPVGLQDERTARIGETIRQTMRRHRIPGISIAVIDRGQVVWAQGFGWRDIERRLHVDTDTLFQAGSISKPFTGLGVLRLAASGEVDLDADVNRYLDQWNIGSDHPENPVTLRLLLCHRAGVVPISLVTLGYDDLRAPPPLLHELNRRNHLAALLTGNHIGPVRIIHPPGTVHQYSGGGYAIVQKVIEDVTKQSFDAFMRERVLGPLRMTHSHFEQPPRDRTNVAMGYGWMIGVVGGPWRNMPERAAGGLWSNPLDLAQFIFAVQKGNAGDEDGPIPPAIVRQLLEARYDSSQGIAVRLDGEGENRGFWHNGRTFGYFAHFGGGVTNGRGFVIMSNTHRQGKFDAIFDSLGREFDWR